MALKVKAVWGIGEKLGYELLVSAKTSVFACAYVCMCFF